MGDWVRGLQRCEVKLPEGLPSFSHIYHNDFVGRKPKKMKDDDVAICFCKYDPNNPESACGEGCLNVMTSTECTPGHCPCQDHCKNQRFQNCEYAKTKLFQTEGRGWGLLADEDIKAGQFIIEYCGEVISLEEAKHRSQSYEAQGLKDAYIISLNSNYFIDATKKGSLARFINHSCLPNCETRKWTVLGETRVGIFAKVDISSGTELSYNYNFEWYGGATVRCLCGAANCCLFLGAKSPGFQAYNHVWEEGDDRYRVEEVPLYDSAEDEPFPRIPETISPFKFESLDGLEADYSQKLEVGDVFGQELDSSNTVKLHNSVQVGGTTTNTEKAEVLESGKSKEEDMQQAFYQTSAVLSGLRSNTASQNFNVGSGSSPKKRSQRLPKQKKRSTGGKQSNTKNIAVLFPSKEAQEEVRKYEEMKNQAAANLKSVYDEIRPAIEKHERDGQDNVPPSVGTKWVGAHCAKYKADLNFSASVIKNFLDIAQKGGSGSKAGTGPKASGSGDPPKE
ncbi:histone-lysine N-methyltransferase ASHH1 isoform X2 [Coffea arabica]|uniref:Histone-lysine N-methyltransferase ASHH1 isoform X2 n=1 Tax=Coffea arabica TaxID=13443 RepID=A0ABM4X3N5_COFAR